MDLVQTEAAANWPVDAIHVEHFGVTPLARAAPDAGFAVRLARRGVTYLVLAEKTIVETLRAHGVQIETSCLHGICGTCVVGVLEGQPDHRDVYLTEKERRGGRKIVSCVSRSKTALLVLDL
jgi:vanillate O-demethylase ferredoxin subunit